MFRKILFSCLGVAAFSLCSAQTMKEWQDPGVNAVGRLPMHSAYGIKESDNSVTLNGVWRFNFVQDADQRPTDFYRPDYNDAGWSELAVPAIWQFSGYGDPQYINTGYAWRNQFESNPPEVPVKGNHVGSYRRSITIPASWKGKDVIAHFGSVTSCMYLWVNGKFVGYSEDSKLEPEFDITKFVVPGKENLIAFQVFRWCDGTYLEDQDFFRYNGVARDCYLMARPAQRIEDIRVTPDLDANYKDGTLAVDLKYKGKGALVRLSLCDADGREVASGIAKGEKALLKVMDPHKWSAETPYLYTLSAKMDGCPETISVETGFRKIELRDSQILVNGQPVLFKGADRHELDPDGGYVLSKERMIQDIKLMKELNINAVRTCHYPDDDFWYQLCDRYGIYMVAEANIESHGMGYDEKTLAIRPDFHTAHQERNERNVARNFNHPAVIFWSLGNEAGYGKNFEDAYDLVKSMDSSRPVQYERAGRDGKTDIYCPMYYGYKSCEDYSANEAYTKPLIQCEYAHAMGNSEGGFKEYWDLVRKYPKYQGGFIWDFVDQSPHKVGTNGKLIYAYGGDYNRYDAGDGNFCDNGLVSPDRVPNPHAYEVQRVYQDIHTSLKSSGETLTTLEVYNENFFRDLTNYSLEWTLLCDGNAVRRGYVESLSVAPQGKVSVSVPTGKIGPEGEWLLNVSYALKSAEGLLPAGWIIAKDQMALTGFHALSPAGLPEGLSPLKVNNTDYQYLIVEGDGFRAEIDKHSGLLSKYCVGGVDMIAEGSELRPNFWRAPTDNDYGAGLQRRYAAWKNPEMILSDFGYETVDGQVEVMARLDMPDLEAALALSYTIRPDGQIAVQQSLKTSGGKHPGMFRFGMTMAMPKTFERVSYYGRGPWENYADRQQAADLGIYDQSVAEQFYAYIRPQENGTKTDIRWWKMLRRGGDGLEISASEPFSASALGYSQESLDNGQDKTNSHSPEVEESEYTHLSIDLKQIGLGCEDSWGRIARPEYLLPYGDYSFSFTLRPTR